MLSVIKTRRSIRNFEERIIDKNDLKEIIEAGMYAPSAGNEQAWQFIVIEGDKLKQFLSLNQNIPSSVPLGVLICRDTGLEKYKGLNSSIFDCSAAAQNMLLAAHSKGYGSLWCYIFESASSGIKKLLNIPEGVIPFSFICIGYSKNQETKTPERYDGSKVHNNSW